jgi:NAD(P)-dependent dehydrogenase (short-subunit alcohol dehydrogenase family)
MTVLITGASRGIGAGLAEHYRAKGVDVIGTGRSANAELQLDVTLPNSHREMAETLGETLVELLICNAGVYFDKGHRIEDGYGPDLWAQTIQALMPHLRRAQNAKIAIISSQMASDTRAPGGSYIYRSSKAAVLNLGRNLSADLKAEGIAVGIYHPGWVQTDMGGDAADITTDEAVQGLAARFDALSIATTGCFETWDGRAHAY